MAAKKAIEIGTEWTANDRQVPCYKPAVGVSAVEAAKSLGLVLLARRESSALACAAVTDGGGLVFWARKA